MTQENASLVPDTDVQPMKSIVPDRTEVRRAVAALIFITMLWGASFPLVKMNNALIERNQRAALGADFSSAARFDLDLSASAATMVLRFGLAFIILMIAFPRQFGGMTLRQWLLGAGAGIVFAVGLLLQIFALNEIPASRSGFLTSLSVVFTPLLLVFILRRPPPWHVIVAVLAALAGVAILTESVQFDSVYLLTVSEDFSGKIGVGDVLTILAAAVFAVEILMIDAFSRRMPPALLTPGMFAATICTGAVVFSVHQCAWAAAPPLASWANLLVSPGFLLLSLAICVGCTLVPFDFMNRYQAKVSPTQAALIYTLEPICTVLWAAFLPGLLSPRLGLDYPSETATWALLAGGALVMVGNVLGFEAAPPSDAAGGGVA